MSLFNPDYGKYQLKYRETAQRKLGGEEVLAVGMFYRTGTLGSLPLAEVSGVAYLASRAIGKKKAGGLSQNVLLVLTPDRLYAFNYAPKGTSIKIKGEEAVWERSAVGIEVENTSLTQRITISSPSEDERVVLDSNRRSGARMNGPLLELLGAGPGE